MFMKKLISIVLCVVMLSASVIVLVPEMTTDVFAATYVKGSNTAHSSYLTSKYYDYFTKLTLTGDNRSDVLAVALSQLGYKESTSEDNLSGIVDTDKAGNYTEYNYNMGSYGAGYSYDWCATFVSWALLQSGATNQNRISDWTRYHDGIDNATGKPDDSYDSAYIWREGSCPHWVNQLKNAGYFEYGIDKGGNYVPQSADLIYFQNAGSSSVSHIGIVVYTDDTYVYTVEGNTSDQSGLEANGNGVYFKKYLHESSYILGYGKMPYKENSNTVKIDYSGANPSAGLYVSDRAKKVYTTENGSETVATMPRFTMFEVTEIAANGRLKAKYTDGSGNTVNGWVVNDSERVIQLTTYATTEPVSMTLECIDENGKTLKTQTVSGYNGATSIIDAPVILGYACDLSKVAITYKSGDTVTLNYRPVLDVAISAASGTRYCDYTPSALSALRSAYTEAVEVKNNTSATTEQKIAAADKLQKAIADNIYKETIISKGKSYTTSAVDRTDAWKDDQIRLTDGVKGSIGNSDGFAGWAGKTDVVVDLGANVSSNVYRVYIATNAAWGINVPASFTVSVSNDKSNWTEVGNVTSETYTATQGVWDNYYMTVRADKTQTARYVKFSVKATSGHVWLEEVEVATSGIGATGEIYIDGINTRVTEGKTVVFTSDFGVINGDTANHKYTVNIVAAWNNDAKAYIVKSISYGKGDTTPSVSLASDEILIASHAWETNVTNPVYRSETNVKALETVAKGDKLTFTNVDIANGTLGAAATVSVVSGGGVADLPQNVVLGKEYTADGIYVVDGSALYPDENGKTLTDGIYPSEGIYSDPAFVGFNKSADYVVTNGYANITVDLGAVYSLNTFVVSAGSEMLSSGIAAPKGIEVYTSMDGNKWTKAGAADYTDDASVMCVDATVVLENAVNARYVQYRVLPHTEVGSIAWMFICEVEAYGVEFSGGLGDINASGKVDSLDYLLVKRACFGTYTLSDDEATRANIDGDGKIDSADYLLVKRIAFGTYKV